MYDSVVREVSDATALLANGLTESQPSEVGNDSMKCLQVFQSTDHSVNSAISVY